MHRLLYISYFQREWLSVFPKPIVAVGNFFASRGFCPDPVGLSRCEMLLQEVKLFVGSDGRQFGVIMMASPLRLFVFDLVVDENVSSGEERLGRDSSPIATWETGDIWYS